MTAATQEIAAFIHDRSFNDFPPAAAERSRKVIADTVAAMLAGSCGEVTSPLLRYLRIDAEGGTAALIGHRERCTPETAAMINGTFGHALDFDDVLSMMPGHPSAVILAALFADLHHHPLNGEQLIEAHVIGVEIGGKIGLGITNGHYRRGFHGTGTLGIFSATAALCKAYRLAPRDIQTAFGIAGSMSSGLRRNFGTMTKPLHSGWAARCALTAVRLAMSGFTAAQDILESRSGFFSTYGVEESNPSVTAENLGSPWVITDPGIALKQFPCCYACHRGMDGILTLRRQLGFTAADIVNASCRMPPGGMQVLTYDNPQTGLEAKFSLPYAIAAGIIDGEYTLRSFADEAVQRPVAREMMKRIKAFEDPACRGSDPLFDSRSSGSRGFVEVDIELKSGLRKTIRIEKPPGHPDRELSWDALARKFDDCAAHAGIDPQVSSDTFTRLRSLDKDQDTASCLTALTR